MLVQLPWAVVVVLDAGAWALWSLVVGRYQAGRSRAVLSRPGPLTRLHQCEIGGRGYERRLRITRWKDLLPEAGGWFGGMSKRHLPAAADGGVQRFAEECLRAERTHLGILALTPALAIWNPIGLLLANVAFALVANVPCLLVARYNRARIAGIEQRRGRGRQSA